MACLCLGNIATGQVITEYAVPTADTTPFGIAAGPDGNVWFAEVAYSTCAGPSGPSRCPVGGLIARIDPHGAITEFPTTAGSPPAASLPFDITAGPDGNLWFTADPRPGLISTSGAVTQLETYFSSSTKSIASGPDGNLWLTEIGNKLARITPAGATTEFTLSASEPQLQGIAAGPDGNVWFTEAEVDRIGRITMAGAVTEFAVPAAGSYPMGIAAGPDGNVWFTEWIGNKIGRITRDGTITEFTVPTSGSEPLDIVAGPDGNLWFTEEVANKIGRITPAGVISEYVVPTAGALPFAIAAGPDGNLWFTEIGSLKVGRITTSGSPACTADPHTLCLDGGRFSVTADFQAASGGPSAPARAVGLTNDTGYFWFFEPANIELVAKVLDGCGVNGAYWVFAGGLTNVGVELKVTDTRTEEVKSYSNALGTPFRPVQDPSAFVCP